MKQVSIVIPNYNGMKFLPECMEALEKQTYRDFEVILIDNASADESADWIRANCPDVRLIVNETNLGFSGAVNQGIQMSECPYVLLLNNDTAAEPDFVGELVKAIEKSNRIFSVSPKMVQYHNHALLDDAGDLYNLLGWAFQRGVGQPVEAYDKPTRVFTACAGASIYRRSVFEEIGYFDLMHFAYLEDLDVGYRARIYGYENWYCPTAVVYHVGSGTSGSKYNDFKVRLAARNNVYLKYKNMPAFQRGLNWLPFQIGLAVKKRFFRKIGFSQAYLDGLEEGMRTRSACKRVPFRLRHLKNYVRIEGELIGNSFRYVTDYLKRRRQR